MLDAEDEPYEPAAARPRGQSEPGPAGLPAATQKKYIIVRDPEVCDSQGRFVETPALLLGRLGMRGRMAVELPSNNSDFPSCPRRYNLRCRDYGIRWGSPHPLQKPRETTLEDLADKLRQQHMGVWMPEVVGTISSPQYTTEPQANPFHVLLLQLPEGNEWHSKSNAFAAFGDLTNNMNEYWFRSGQKEPTKTRESHHREYLQHLGMQQGGEASLKEVDDALAATAAKLSRQTAMPNKEHLATGRAAYRPSPEAGDAAEVARPDEVAEERGRPPAGP